MVGSSGIGGRREPIGVEGKLGAFERIIDQSEVSIDWMSLQDLLHQLGH